MDLELNNLQLLICHKPKKSAIADNQLMKEVDDIEAISHSKKDGGARGVMVIVVGNGHGDTSSNPGRD